MCSSDLPIRHYGRDDPAVLRRLLESLGRVMKCVPEDRHAPLRAQAEAILRQAEKNLDEPLDLEKVRRAGAWLHRFPGDERGEEWSAGRAAA